MPRGDEGRGFERTLHEGRRKPEPKADRKANGHDTEDTGAGVALADFVAHMPSRSYFFLPTREPWPAGSVNARIAPIPGADNKPVSASSWLDLNCPVEQMTWAPGEPTLIKGRLMSDGGWRSRPGCTVLNLYQPPTIARRKGNALPWLKHLIRVYPQEAHILAWLACRVQRPEVKINHALVLGGSPGIGKDTLLEPVKQGVGPWNFMEASPQQVLGRFNGFLKSVILRVSEARDLGDVDRFTFYDHMKVFTASPPDVLRIDEKNIREYSILNVCGIIHTTNHKADGLYLPPDDRRHFVAWSERTATDFKPGYWRDLYRWFQCGGHEAVAAYLHDEVDLGAFDPKAPPPKTEAFWEIVNSNAVPETSEMTDLLEKLGRPDVTTLSSIKRVAEGTFAEWLGDRRNARKIPFRLEEAGYVVVRNPDAEDGRWRIDGTKQAIYGRRDLTPRARLVAVADLSSGRA